MTKPLVSIIMAAKDTAEYIRECIDSIIQQTYSNWELIVVNDHSTDATPEILKEFADKDARIKVFHSRIRRLIPALQLGFQMCEGELINRMDSDDRMPKDKVEVLVNAWKKYGRGTVVAGGTEHFVETGEVGGGFRRYEQWLNRICRNQEHYQEIYRECVIPSHCWIIHREDFLLAGAFDRLVYPEDYDLCFRFYSRGYNIVGLDKILHYWRDRSDRISRTWEEYEDNRYFELKWEYFFRLDHDCMRPLVIWGAGRNGKDLIKLILKDRPDARWICDSENKIGKDIYGITLRSIDALWDWENPQIIIAVASPDSQREILGLLQLNGKKAVEDYWFFL